MPVDTSIYGILKQPEMPDLMGSMGKAMSLKQLQMQNDVQQRQLDAQDAMRNAFAQNVAADGTLNRGGVLSALKDNPQALMQTSEYLNKFDKDTAEAQSKKNDAYNSTQGILTNYYDIVKAAKPEDQPALYASLRADAIRRGVDPRFMPEQFDPQHFAHDNYIAASSAPALEKQKTISEIGKNNNEGLIKGADELEKYKDDVANPTNRKVSGNLTDVINRADRIAELSNAGAQPGETPQQRTARLNAIIPQIAKEFNVSMASIMNGGVPSDALMKELGTDTMDSTKAAVLQRVMNDPTGAQQAKFIEQMVGTAQHLRGFAANRLQDISTRTRAAYPYANRYYSGEMDKIGSPLPAPELSGQGTMLAKGGAGKSIFGKDVGANSANASDAKAAPKFSAGDTVLYKGKHYKVGPDGDSLIPVGGNK